MAQKRGSLPTNNNKASQERAYKVPTEDLDNRQIVRVGRLVDKGDSSNPNAIPMRVIVVALVDPERNNRVAYHAIDAWRIREQRIGDYSSADPIKSIYNINGFAPDVYFNRAYLDGMLDKAILDWLEAKQPRTIKDDDSDTSAIRRKRASRRTELAPKKHPIKPKHSLREHEVPGKRHRGGERDIDTVVTFYNDLTTSRLNLPRNLQASLDHDEDILTFAHFIHDVEVGQDGDITMGELFSDDSFQYWAVIEVWVLPQGAKEMVKWAKNSGLVARNFLDPDERNPANRQLYIQVRIKESSRSERRNQTWWSSLSDQKKREVEAGVSRVKSEEKKSSRVKSKPASNKGNIARKEAKHAASAYKPRKKITPNDLLHRPVTRSITKAQAGSGQG